MSNFITDNTALPFPKTDVAPIDPSSDPTKYVQALDWNTICQALLDVRGYVTSTTGSNANRFVYTATGAEGNGLFTVAIAPRSNTNYVAQVIDGGRVDGNIVLYTAPVANYALSSIGIRASAHPAGGDKIIVIIQDRA